MYRPIFTGGETRTIESARGKACSKGACTERVETITLDDFFERQQLLSVYHLAIDTEGHDPLVLEGAAKSIRERKIAIIEFEVNSGGHWTTKKRSPFYRDRRTLRSAIARLEDAQYACFWQMRVGLVPLSGECWRPEFEQVRKWSNIVCAHEPPVVAALLSLRR